MKEDQNLRPLRKVKKIPKEIPLPEEKIPVWSLVLLGLFVLSLVLLFVAKGNPIFAEWFNQTISASLRVFLAFVTNLLPFSLAELLVLMSPLFLVLVIVYAVKHKTKSWKCVLSYTVSLLSAVSLLFSLFVFVYGVGYHTPTLDTRLSLCNEAVSAEELAETAKILVREIKDELSDIRFGESGASIIPFSLSEMNDKLTVSYKSLAAKHDFLQAHHSRIKPVLLSVPMSYAHFTGFYTFFTGESNLNVDFPDYTLPFTAAHELAHGRGIARENEANFIAFLVCMESEHPYLRYCGLLNLYEYVAAALYEADTTEEKVLYKEVTSLLDARVVGELTAFSEFFDTYRGSHISRISGAINDGFLKANGEEDGEKSYGLVVNLAVSYYKDK